MATNRKSTAGSTEPAGTNVTLQQENNEKFRQAQTQNQKAAAKLKAEQKIAVVGAPMYQAYFGLKMPIVINGVAIYVPLDGRQYEIPKSYAEIFFTRLNSVNEDIELAKRRANSTANFESYAGELDLIKPV